MPEAWSDKLRGIVRQEEVACLACHWRGWASWLSSHLLRDHDCPGCDKVGTLICTGQPVDHTDALDIEWRPLGHRIITPREGLG